jgi:amidase
VLCRWCWPIAPPAARCASPSAPRPWWHHPRRVAAAIQGAADAFATAGAQVTEAIPESFVRAVELWGLILNAELRVQKPLLEMVMGAAGTQFLNYAEEVYPPIDISELMLAFAERNAVDREWHTFLTDYDVLLMPTWTEPPFELGADIVSVQAAQGVLEQARPILPANLLGLPSAIVPVGMADGLPVGAQLVGRRFADLTCLAAAEVLEQAFGTITPIDPVLG